MWGRRSEPSRAECGDMEYRLRRILISGSRKINTNNKEAEEEEEEEHAPSAVTLYSSAPNT